MLIQLGESYVNTDHIVTIMDGPTRNTTVIQFVAGPTMTLHGAGRHMTMDYIQSRMKD